MCGIVGYLDKSGNEKADVGQTIFRMLKALGQRGPDSSGVAIFGPKLNGDLLLRVKLGDTSRRSSTPQDFIKKGKQVAERVKSVGQVDEASTTAEYLRLVMNYSGDPRELESRIESSGEDIEVVSMGRSLEIVKQVGSPEKLDETYSVSSFAGSHGIGHTRLCTESIIDLSHSQPFWSHGYPDLATVHNGHITNSHTLRRLYAPRGAKYYTENDSEIIAMYLAEKLSAGMGLEEALKASLKEFDGSFSYFVATPEAMGFVRDPFALKPLLMAETDKFVVLANEELAIRAGCEGDYEVREVQAGEVRLWQR